MEAFTRLAGAARGWTERGTVTGFLFTAAHRLCLDLLRRRRTARRLHEDVVELTASRAITPSPEARALFGELAARAEQAIARLPEEHRTCLLLCAVQGFEAAEAAGITGMTEQQVRSAVSYARKRLRRELGEDGAKAGAVP